MAPPPYGFADPSQVITDARAEVVAAARPKMRGLLAAQIRRNIVVAMVLAAVGGYTFKIGVCDVRKQRYAEFYRTYDAEEAFEGMRKRRLFQSC